MRGPLRVAVVILVVVLVSEAVIASYATRHDSHLGHHHRVPRTRVDVKAKDKHGPHPERQAGKLHVGSAPLQVAGSRLPDCSHACGSCSPCQLVTVRFLCSWLAEAETCPLSYKCMCNNKSYPVP